MTGLSVLRGRRRVEPVLRRLNTLFSLTPAEIALVEGLAHHVEEHRAGQELMVEGGTVAPRLLLSGWACRQRLLRDGRRQIFDFLIAGDTVGLSPAPRPLAQCSTVALSRAESVDASPLKAAASDPVAYPNLARLMDRIAWDEESRLLDHMVRLGRCTAYERMVHLLLELRDRHLDAGLGAATRFPMPITQEALSDVLGLSIVHINRVLQQLRREGLIELRAGHVTLANPEGLTAVGDNIRLASG